jgi:hypothetical protein
MDNCQTKKLSFMVQMFHAESILYLFGVIDTSMVIERSRSVKPLIKKSNKIHNILTKLKDTLSYYTFSSVS